MKILMLNYEFPPIGGGGGKAHLNLLKEYSKTDDLEVVVLTSKPTLGFEVEQFSDNIQIHKIGLHKKSLYYWRKVEVLEWLFKAYPRYKKVLDSNQYDLVHAFFGFPSGWLCYRSRKKIPYIISLRGSDVPGQNKRLGLDYKLLSPVFKKIWNNASALIACSNGLKERALKFLPVAGIGVIANGVDTGKFKPVKVNDSNSLKLITVGRLSETKRVDLLIDAVERMKKQGTDVSLVIVGDGRLRNSLEQQILSRKLSNNIIITGFVKADDMPQYYSRSDLYISATMQEGMSNAMLEAMASGLPIVTTKCEGVDELIDDNGIVVEKAEGDYIAKVIMELIDDNERYKKMTLTARGKAEQFTWEKVAEQYIECYHNMIAGKGQK
ncbi:MAG: hypothetical protein DRP56_06080 [Planctomycetota bacterium]|nr:MAG: hypothetical protein DRP56_06080 [Planctomycetota bacterium]